MGFRRTLIVALIAATPLARAAEDPARVVQERIKAAFLYKFASYVEWPREAFPQPESPIVIGISGADHLAGELEHAVAGRQVAGRPLKVRRLARGEAANDCCQILFVGSGAERGRATELLADAEGRPVLTVTDTPEHPKGSIINFLAAEDRVRFDISREAAERNRLQLRLQLLGVARQVVPQ